MTFLETQRFDDNIAFGAVVGPTYLTVINQVYSGRDNGIVAWTQSRIRFDVGRRAMNKADTETLVAFFRAVKGRGYRFRIKDWTDFTATTANGVLTATATAGVYQLGKRYVAGTLSETRTIQKPVVGTVVAYKNGVALTSGYSLDTTTGLLTITPTPLNTDVLAWAGQFDVPARFDTDEMKMQVMDRNGARGDLLVDWGSIPIIEVRP